MNTNTNTKFSYLGTLRELAAPYARRDESGALRIPRGDFEVCLLTRVRDMRHTHAHHGQIWPSHWSQAVKRLRHLGRSGAVKLDDIYRDCEGDFPAYTSMGCYPIAYIGDGFAYCADCTNEVDQDPDCADESPITCAAPTYEDAELYCDRCHERIESAYAEPDDGDE